MSPSIRRLRVVGVLVNAAPNTVIPDPGELIRSSARIPLFSNAARLTFARTSFSADLSTRRPLGGYRLDSGGCDRPRSSCAVGRRVHRSSTRP